MAYAPDFTDPNYGMPGILGGWGQQPQPGGILGNYAAAAPAPPQAQPAAPQGMGGDWRTNPVLTALGSSLLANRGALGPGMAQFGQMAPQAMADQRKRAALNDLLKSKSFGADLSPETKAYMVANPEFAQQMVAYNLTPRAPVIVPPGSTVLDPVTRQPIPGSSPRRGDGSPYDLEQAAKAYKAKYGEGANLAIDAPDEEAWYKSPNGWPSFGQNQPAGAADAQALPKRPLSDTDIRRYNMAANSATKNWLELPGYKLVAQGAPYLSRIEAASQHPGSISDQELLDSVTKLNNAGGQVTEAQVGIVLKGSSLKDKINVWSNMISKTGGVLSDDQRKQLVDVAHAVYRGYQKMYQPVYDDAIRKLKAQGIPEQYWNIPDLNSLSNAAGIAGGNGEAPKPGDNGGSAPPPAIEFLKANPSLRDAFDAKYGQGAAAQILGQ